MQQANTKGEGQPIFRSLFLQPMARLGLLLLFLTCSQLAIGFRVAPVKALKRNEVVKKVRSESRKGPSQMKTLEMSRQTGSFKEISTSTSSAPEAFHITPSRPPTQEAATKYWETNNVIPRSEVISRSTKIRISRKKNKKFRKTSTSQSSSSKTKSSQTKEKASSICICICIKGLVGNQISLSRGGKINVMVSAKEDTQRVVKKKVQPVPEKSPEVKTFEKSTPPGGSSEKTAWETKNIGTHKKAIPRSGKINVVVSSSLETKEDTQRIIRMIKHQIKCLIRREVKKEVEKDIMPLFVQKHLPIPFMGGMGLFLKQQIIHRMLKQYTARMNIYARLLR